jgi:hypothetical protein
MYFIINAKMEDNIAEGRFQVTNKVVINAIHLAQFHTILTSAILHILYLAQKLIHLVVIYSLVGLIG